MEYPVGLKFALVGMSGVGKSKVTERLRSEYDFIVFSCDPMISNEIRASGSFPETLPGMEATDPLAEWLQEDYQTRAERYLEAEEAVVKQAVSSVNALGDAQNAVIDTTGSLVHTTQETQDLLRDSLNLVVVHLELSDPDFFAKVVAKLQKNNKPVIGRDEFPDDEAFVEYREKRYSNLAAMALDAYEVRQAPTYETIDRIQTRIRTL